MNPRSRLIPFVASFALIPLSASAQDLPVGTLAQEPATEEAPKDVVAPLGPSFTTVYFKRGWYSPHVAIKVPFLRVLESVLDSWKEPVDVETVKKKLAEAMTKHEFWVLFGSDPTGKKQCPALLEGIDSSAPNKDVVLIFDAKASYNTTHLVSFRLEAFRAYVKGENPSSLESCPTEGWQKGDPRVEPAHLDTDPRTRKPYWCKRLICKMQRDLGRLLINGDKGLVQYTKFSNRFSFEVGGSGLTGNIKLITAEPDGMGGFTFDTSNGRRYELKAVYSGSRHFIPYHLSGGTYSDLEIKSTVSEFQLDQEAVTTIQTRSVVPGFLSSGAAGMFTTSLASTQSARVISLVVGLGERFGDKRAENRRSPETSSLNTAERTFDSKGLFIPMADIKDGVYFEYALEPGFIAITKVKRVPPEAFETGFVLRGRATLGFTEIKTSLWNLAGEASVYYLFPGANGAADRDLKFAETASLTFAIKSGANSQASVTYTFGRSPDTRFNYITPKLTFKVIQKF